MKRLIFISGLCIIIFLNTTSYSQTSCIECHKQLDDSLKQPVDEMAGDIHAKNDITCVSCHGGNADLKFADAQEAAMDPKKGYIGIPLRLNIPKLCAKCHSDASYIRTFNPNLPTDQYQRYLTSQHGMQLIKGDKKVAICTDCHGIHLIQAGNVANSKVYPNNIPKTCAKCHSNAEYMQGYNLPVDQYELYVKSIHGINLFEKGDRTSPTCNDCHGNHGAVPPGISSISHVCGVCHVSQVEMFEQSTHKTAFAEMGLPQCESCHGNHKIDLTNANMLGIGSESFCTTCHEEESKGFMTAQNMKQIEDSLMTKMELATGFLERAEKAGVEVSDAKFILQETNNNLVKLRNSVHFFSLEKFQTISNGGFISAEKAIAEGKLALNEVQNRRIWLAIISILIFLAAISLYFTIKQFEKSRTR